MSSEPTRVQSTPRSGEPQVNDRDLLMIDGQRPDAVIRPGSVEELAGLLRAAGHHGPLLVPVGGATQLGYGNLIRRPFVAIELTAFDRIVDYEPNDLTVSVEAGCTVAALNRRLGQHGQFLPVETADPERATVGGVYATGLAGPRRFGHGSLRDLIIGISVLYPDGRIGRGGGMVVKNVSGFDMMRLHYGALGALGIIVRLNFKVLPRPRAQRTVAAGFDRLADAVDAAMRVRLSQLAPTAIVVLNRSSAQEVGFETHDWALLLRAEAPEGAVEHQAQRLIEALESPTDTDVLDEPATESIWQAVASLAMSDGNGQDVIGIRLGVAPSGIGEVVAQLHRLALDTDPQARVVADYGTGLVYLRQSADRLSPGRGQEIWEQCQTLGRHASLIAAPVELKATTDVFGRSVQGLEVMRGLKRQFDPAGVLNAGRFIGRL